MMVESHRQLESAESASPVITRLLGKFLAGEQASVFEFKAWEKLGLKILNNLPLSFARQAVRWRFKKTALDPVAASEVMTADLVDARLVDYERIRADRYPAVMVGAALGGASAHLAAVLGIPYLPQPFILGLRGGSADDGLIPHLELTSQVADQILSNNDELMAIAHFDPIHDGWLTRILSHLRLKLITLPVGYQVFLREVLEPGGVILYLDCRARWLQYQLAERFRYQVGGWGGIAPNEFLNGSERIDRALEQAGSPHRGGWTLDGHQPVEKLESEWGSEPGLDLALEAFAQSEGFRFERIIGKDPHAFSILAYKAHERMYQIQDRPPQGTVVETFTQYDPGLVLRGGFIPLWLIFNTTDSLAFLKKMSVEFDRDLPVFFSGLVTLSRTPDMVAWHDWANALSEFDFRSIGARPGRYPEDLVSLWAWSERLYKQRDRAHWDANPLPLALSAFLELSKVLGMSL